MKEGRISSEESKQQIGAHDDPRKTVGKDRAGRRTYHLQAKVRASSENLLFIDLQGLIVRASSLCLGLVDRVSMLMVHSLCTNCVVGNRSTFDHSTEDLYHVDIVNAEVRSHSADKVDGKVYESIIQPIRTLPHWPLSYHYRA